MANHVQTHIEVKSDNPQVYQKLMDMLDNTTWKDWENTMFIYNLVTGNEDDDYNREEYIETIGAKWVYFDEVHLERDSAEFEITSAWDYVEGFIYELSYMLSQIDPMVMIEFHYEDESMSPVGGGAIYKEELINFETERFGEWPDEDADDYDLLVDEHYEKVWHQKEEFIKEAKYELREEPTTDDGDLEQVAELGYD